jgi:hypothetical protein
LTQDGIYEERRKVAGRPCAYRQELVGEKRDRKRGKEEVGERVGGAP